VVGAFATGCSSCHAPHVLKTVLVVVICVFTYLHESPPGYGLNVLRPNNETLEVKSLDEQDAGILFGSAFQKKELILSLSL
jgi:hypothetical protein